MKSQGQIQPYHKEDTSVPQHPTQDVVVREVSRQGMTAKEIILVGALGIGVTAGIIWLLVKTAKNIISHKEYDKTFEDDTSAAWAKQIKMALDGRWGTDEAGIRKVLREMKTYADFEATAKSFKRLYEGKNLLETFEEELSPEENNEFLAIIAGKPKKPGDPVIYNYKAWAERLYNAMSQTYFGFWPGTDEDAIETVFNEIPNYSAYINVAVAYEKEYGTSLYYDLLGDMELYVVMGLINKVKKKG